MNLKWKIRIDNLIGLPILFLLNFLARILGFFLQINHSFNKKPNYLIVSKFLGLGSIIQSSPMLQTLKRNYPNSKLVFITSKANILILKHYPFVDEIIVLNDKNIFTTLISTIQILPKLLKMRNSFYFDLEIYSNFSAILNTLSFSRNRIGFYRKDSNVRMGIYTHMMYFNNRVPISEVYLQMARLSGCTEIISSLYKFEIDENDTKNAQQKLNINDSNSIIIINPNASDLRIERRWETQNFVDLISKLKTKFPEKTYILIGSKSEKSYVDLIFNSIENKQNLINSAGKISLNELIAIINKADLIITNDTGPMHISFALNKKTIAFFGPTHPNQYGNENAICFYKNVYCSPCVHEFLTPPCKGNNICVKNILVEEVFETCVNVIEKNIKSTPKNPILYTENSTVLGFLNR